MLPAGRRSARTDDGISLVELILAVALLGTAAVTLLGAFGTLIKTGDQSKKNGDLTTTLSAASEFVIDNSRTAYVACGAAVAAYNTALAAFVAPATIGTVSVTSVQQWNGTDNRFDDGCYDTVKPWRLQLLTLQVGTRDGQLTRSITVVKRG